MTPTPNIVPWNIEELELHLQGRLGGRIRNLRLHQCRSGIVLRGIARTYYAKQLAQHAVLTEARMPILANEIEVH